LVGRGLDQQGPAVVTGQGDRRFEHRAVGRANGVKASASSGQVILSQVVENVVHALRPRQFRKRAL